MKEKMFHLPANTIFKTICMICSVLNLAAHINEDGKLIQSPGLAAVCGPLAWVKTAMSRQRGSP